MSAEAVSGRSWLSGLVEDIISRIINMASSNLGKLSSNSKASQVLYISTAMD